jgi:hypothetical protein
MPRATNSEALQPAHTRSNIVEASSTRAGVTLIRTWGAWLRQRVRLGVVVRPLRSARSISRSPSWGLLGFRLTITFIIDTS